MRHVVKVYLLHVGDGAEARQRVFYSEPPADIGPDDLDAGAVGARGFPGWIERWFRRVKHESGRSHSRAARLTRRLWVSLHRRHHPDETLLARLRLARAIHLHHPASMTREEVLAAWSAFLVAGRWRHWPWFLVNALIAPLTILLIPLPGPNLIGYWFTYRALHHVLI